MDIVRDDFDQIGLMVKSKLIPEKEFLERYWDSVLDCRKRLEKDIEAHREIRNYDDYVKNFDDLKKRAERYAKNNGYSTIYIDNIKPYDISESTEHK